MPQNHRQIDFQLTFPQVHIRPANPRHFRAHQGRARLHLRQFEITKSQWRFEILQNGRARKLHRATLPPGRNADNSICIRLLLFHPTGMPKQFWLVKQEPEAYSWDNLVKDGGTSWTGVRNFQARNNLRAMKKGDIAFFYHSVSGKQVVGLATVAKEAYADPTADEGDWSTVDLKPLKPLKQPVSLDQIKADAILKEMKLVRQSRLSVTPVTQTQADRLLKLGGTSL